MMSLCPEADEELLTAYIEGEEGAFCPPCLIATSSPFTRSCTAAGRRTTATRRTSPKILFLRSGKIVKNTSASRALLKPGSCTSRATPLSTSYGRKSPLAFSRFEDDEGVNVLAESNA
jgi:hypothetical protein